MHHADPVKAKVRHKPMASKKRAITQSAAWIPLGTQGVWSLPSVPESSLKRPIKSMANGARGRLWIMKGRLESHLSSKSRSDGKSERVKMLEKQRVRAGCVNPCERNMR
jgi:hypothetical protein